MDCSSLVVVATATCFRDSLRRAWPVQGVARLVQNPERGSDGKDWQTAQEVVSFLFYYFDAISPHELLFFPVDKTEEDERGSVWCCWQGGGVVGVALLKGALWS